MKIDPYYVWYQLVPEGESYQLAKQLHDILQGLAPKYTSPEELKRLDYVTGLLTQTVQVRTNSCGADGFYIVPAEICRDELGLSFWMKCPIGMDGGHQVPREAVKVDNPLEIGSLQTRFSAETNIIMEWPDELPDQPVRQNLAFSYS